MQHMEDLQGLALKHVIPHRTFFKDLKERGYYIMAKGDGFRVTDAAGREYIDLSACGTRANAVGFGRKEIADAIYEQAMALHYYTPDSSLTPVAIKLAAKLAQITPGDLDQFFFVSGGSEAIEAAMKLAKQHHYFKGDYKRFKVISRRLAFHGATMGALSATASMSPMREIMEPGLPGRSFIPAPTCYRCPFRKNYPGCDLDCARALEDQIQTDGPEQVSAFVAEPVMQGGGCQVPPPEYLPMVRDICKRYGIIFIIDEIITAFGRTGKMFACEHFGIVPDLMTIAKGFSSGYIPLGAVAAKPFIIEPFPIFSHIHTYGNHPVACAAALKNIEIIEREGLVENARVMGQRLLQGLRTLEKHKIVGNVRGIGLWSVVEFVRDKKTKSIFPDEQNPARVLARRAREKGYIINVMANCLEFAPSLVVTKEAIDGALTVVGELIAAYEKEMGL